ncbi:MULTISPECIES: N-acetylmuramoyl-L-alanine amidase [Streptomyces]|uniref:N-acetylmuramoyl-L-alanine amidase n=2 Tax=Streptomyces TaxID=1883 RepID=A0A100Y4D2_9ACTN|nr:MULTISPECIES: N-acetylmuramoyl-L-alanine amidase [Streptomyces]KUH37410.1 N-acetylmuramoyl-L-alanine amidase [Streptomyces kanasensis]UUS31383.1 N-acetylmuramoyl-L-alanine amidase [Streptomyces changanensis]
MRSIRIPLIGVAVAVTTASSPALAMPLSPAHAATAAPTASTAPPSVKAADDTPDPGATRSLPLVPLPGDERSTAPGGGAARGLPRQEVDPFSMIGVVWDDPDAELHGTVQVRTRATGTGAWSPWQDLETHQGDHGADPGSAEARSTAVRGGTAPLWVGDSDGVEVRVLPEPAEDRAGRAPALPGGLRAELVDPGGDPAPEPGTDDPTAQDAPPDPAADVNTGQGATADPDPATGPATDAGPGTATDPATDPASDADPATDTDTDTGTDADQNTDPASDTDTGADADADADQGAEEVADGPADEAVDPPTEVEESADHSIDPDAVAPVSGAALSPEETAASAANSELGASLGAVELPEMTEAEWEAAGPAAAYAAPRPGIVTRKGWGADEKLREPSFLYTKSVQVAFVHHSATGNNYTCAQAPSVLRGIYRYHVKSMGWRDLGYNFAVDKCGKIYEGRAGGVAKAVQGAHTLGFNTNSTGIAVLGSYGGTTPPAKAVTGVAKLTAWKLGLYSKDPKGKSTLVSGGGNRYAKGTKVKLNTISGHRDGYSTECPGAKLYGKLGTIRTAAATYQGRS